jgi:putative transposase
MPLLTNDPWRSQLARCIDAANREEQMNLVAFVFMPEHVHLLIVPSVNEPDMGRYLALIKQPFSKSIKRLLIETNSPLLRRLTVQERPSKTSFRFWQEGPRYDRNLNTAKAIRASIDYIHCNPVTRKLCRQAVDWKWSSARCLLDSSYPPDPDLPFLGRLPAGAIDT